MRERLHQQIDGLVRALLDEAGSPGDPPEFVLEVPRSKEHGDFACNVAMLLAKRGTRILVMAVWACLVSHVAFLGFLVVAWVAAVSRPPDGDGGPAFVMAAIELLCIAGIIADIRKKREVSPYDQI